MFSYLPHLFLSDQKVAVHVLRHQHLTIFGKPLLLCLGELSKGLRGMVFAIRQQSAGSCFATSVWTTSNGVVFSFGLALPCGSTCTVLTFVNHSVFLFLAGTAHRFLADWSSFYSSTFFRLCRFTSSYLHPVSFYLVFTASQLPLRVHTLGF